MADQGSSVLLGSNKTRNPDLIERPAIMSTMTPVQPIEWPGIQEWVPSPLFRMTLEQYEAMVASGAFSERDRFYLLNGFLVEKMTQHDPHATADELCGRALDKVIPPGWHVRSAKPVRLPPNSKPEPDRSVVRGTIRDYSNRSPGPEDIGLILEVSASSLAEDRRQAHVFAASGIPFYWIVNVNERQVEVYRDPTPNGNQIRTDFRAGEKVPIVIDGIGIGDIAVDDLLP
jgi:Uma2 family endonuclease